MDVPRTPLVLVVEDDLGIGSQLVTGLTRAGFRVELQTEGTGAAERALQCACDAIVLDLMLPGATGFEVLDALRDRTTVPVLVLTAGIDLDTRLEAFQRGAADFLPKPFFLEELVARLRARLGGVGQTAEVVRWGAVEADLDGRTVRVDGEDAGLTAHELSVLAVLLRRAGRAVTRATLVEQALSVDGAVSERTVDSHITRVRRKLRADGAAIRTVWGVGYRFEPNP